MKNNDRSSDEADLRKRIAKIMEPEIRKEKENPYSPANYVRLLPEGIEQQIVLTQVHSKKYDDGLEIRIVSRTGEPDEGIEILVCERDPETGWRDVACKKFQFGENHDLKYIVEMFMAYEILHGRDRRYLR